MTLYPIDKQIEELLESLVDEETGELTCSEDEIEEKIEALKVEFKNIVLNLRNDYINRTATAEALKNEKERLAKMQKREEKAAEHDKRFLAYLTKGEKYSDGIVNIGYRKSSSLMIDDKEKLVDWAKQNGPGFLKEPELRLGDIKAAVLNGKDIPFAHIEERNNIQVR